MNETEWTATERAIANLKEAVRILESDGPSLLANLYDEEDAPNWRHESAKQYIKQALTNLAE